MLWTVIGMWEGEPHPEQEQRREGHHEPCETHRMGGAREPTR